MIVLAALSRDGVVGRDGALPWEVPEERQQSLAFLEGKTVLLGRRGFELLGSQLRNAHTLVLSSTGLAGVEPPPNTEVFADFDSALVRGIQLGKPMVCAGGASLFDQAVPLADKLYLSYVEGDFEGDAHFPTFDPADWREERRRSHQRFEFVVLARR